MKKLGGALLALMLIPSFVLAVGDHATIEGVEEHLKEKQGISSLEDLRCDEVENETFIQYGDAVMEKMHPNEDEHRLMDTMMGGEGSASLESMHEVMGKRFLGCWDGDSNFFPMMGHFNGSDYGSGMMNHRGYGYSGMMGFGMMPFGFFGFGGMVFQLITWGLAILGIMFIVKHFKKK